MQDEDLFSHDGPAPTPSDQEPGGEGDRSALPSAPPVSQEAPAPAHPPETLRRRTPRHHLRLLLTAMMVVLLVVLAGGYGIFRALAPTSRQASSAILGQSSLHTYWPSDLAGHSACLNKSVRLLL